MNFKLNLCIAALSAATLFTGCSKDDDDASNNPAPNNPSSSGLLTAKINGTAWAAATDSAGATLVNGMINITGVASDGKTITISLQDTVTGIYDISYNGNHAGVYQTSPTASSSFDSQFGPYDVSTNFVNITSIDKTNKKMTGTFAFKAINSVTFDSVSITEGKFTNLPYVTSVTGTGNNSFAVDIDGVAYTPTLIAGVLQGGNINIIASTNSGATSVGLTVPSNITTGTFSPVVAFGTYSGQYNVNSSLYLAATSGSITITEHNTTTHKIVGTFHFDATEFPTGPTTASLTNGSFTIFY